MTINPTPMPTPPPAPEEKGKTLQDKLRGNTKMMMEDVDRGGPGMIRMHLCLRDDIWRKHYARIEGEREELVEVLGALYQEYCYVMHSEFDYSSADWSPERDNDEVAIRARDLLAKHTTSSPQGK